MEEQVQNDRGSAMLKNVRDNSMDRRAVMLKNVRDNSMAQSAPQFQENYFRSCEAHGGELAEVVAQIRKEFWLSKA